VNLRRNLISAIDIQRFQGQSKINVNPDCRLLVFAADLAFNAGLLVKMAMSVQQVYLENNRREFNKAISIVINRFGLN
jgi:hypothetical protein